MLKIVVAGSLVDLLQQVPGDVLLVALLLIFIIVMFVLTNQRACDRLVRVLEALRKH